MESLYGFGFGVFLITQLVLLWGVYLLACGERLWQWVDDKDKHEPITKIMKWVDEKFDGIWFYEDPEDFVMMFILCILLSGLSIIFSFLWPAALLVIVILVVSFGLRKFRRMQKKINKFMKKMEKNEE